MEANLISSIVTGAFALGGSLSGVLATGYLARQREHERTAIDDRKRWITEWRYTYAVYLGITCSMCDEIEYAGNYLIPEFDKNSEMELDEQVSRIVAKWHAELQPVLGEMLLIATPEVADLAARLADGLLYMTELLVEKKHHSVFESWSNKSKKYSKS